MSQVNMNQATQTQAPQDVDDVTLLNKVVQSGATMSEDVIPPAKDGKPGSASTTELPVLPKPALAAGNSTIALDILLEAIGDKVRQSETKAGISTIQANAQAREAANKEKIAKIEEQIKKLENAGFWDKFTSAFKYIGMALAAVACVAMVATGVGSAVGIAGLALIGVSLANSVLDEVGTAVSGRGWGLTSLIGMAVEKISGSEEAGMWVKMGLDIVISLAAIACTLGAGSGAAISNIAKTAQAVSKVANFTKAGVEIAGAGTSVASSVYTKDAEYARAEQKRLHAFLEQIQMVNDLVTKHMKAVIEDSQKVAETVSDIIKENAATQTAILTGGGGAAMA